MLGFIILVNGFLRKFKKCCKIKLIIKFEILGSETMLKDSRTGWIADLVVGSKVGVSHKGNFYDGTVSLITTLGVLLVRCENNLKFKIMPDGYSSTKESEILPYESLEKS